MPWTPCTHCAIAIIDSGITELVGHKQMIMRTQEREYDSHDYALGLLEKAGVRRFMYGKKLGNISNLMNGKLWFP